MFKTTLIAACAAATLASAGAASAQPYATYAAPMDMTAMMQQQVTNQRVGDAMVRNYQAQMYAALVAARRAGHPFNGRFMPQNNPNTFNSNNWFANSDGTMNAIEDHGYRATRGCYYARDQWGNVGYACP